MSDEESKRPIHSDQESSVLSIDDIDQTESRIVSTKEAIQVQIQESVSKQLTQDGHDVLKNSVEDYLLRLIEKGRSIAVLEAQGERSIAPPLIKAGHIKSAQTSVLRDLRASNQKRMWLLRASQLIIGPFVGALFPSQPDDQLLLFIFVFIAFAASVSIEPWISRMD